jgi:hypothetical protein
VSSESPRELRVEFESEKEFRDVYERDLALGAVFVSSELEIPQGEAVEVKLALGFADTELTCSGEVVGVVSQDMTRAGATPGVSVLLSERGAALRKLLEEAIGLDLPVVDEESESSRRAATRFPAEASVVVEAEGRSFTAETVDVSYNGMLALLNGINIGVGVSVNVRLTHPGSAESIEFAAAVANQTCCDHGVMAVGIQFHYELDRVEEVTGFIDEVNRFHHAKKLARVSGSVAASSLEAILETFSGISSAGTLRVIGTSDEGKIAYLDGQIVCATTGLVSGTKAIGRMFSWFDARFEFEPEVGPTEGPLEHLPLESAVLSAAVERDQIKRLDLKGVDSESTFEVNQELFETLQGDLDEVRGEVVSNGGMGFPLGVVLDMLPWSDAVILQALVDLVECGVLRRSEPSAG